MTDNSEEMLGTLVDAWHRAVWARSGCPPDRRQWWDGLIAGIATGIAVASGLPSGSTSLAGAVQAGCEIARAHAAGRTP